MNNDFFYGALPFDYLCCIIVLVIGVLYIPVCKQTLAFHDIFEYISV